MEDPKYCSYCGSGLNADSNFCPSCGKLVQKENAPSQQTDSSAAVKPTAAGPARYSAVTPQPEAPMPSRETICLVLQGAARHSGFLGLKVEQFVIVFTNLRIIFAFQSMDKMKENMLRARAEAEKAGKGFFGKWGAQLGANTGKEYWEIPPHEALVETASNFAIDREHLRSIRLREETGDENAVSTYRMEFHTTEGKHKFRFGNMNMRELKKQLNQLYGNIVR